MTEMEKRRFNPPDLTDATEETVGPYKLALVYRHIPNDEGPTIHVFGPVGGEEREILRFDCFKNGPHYHKGISYLDEPVTMIDAPDSLAWVMAELGQRFPDYLFESQVDRELPSDWQVIMANAIETFKTSANEWSV
jgi:hypothetical protein